MIDEKLKTEVELTLGHKLQSAADFELLSEQIFQRIHERLSATTIKRIWGYINEDVHPRTSTLDIIARFVGYRNYETFLQSDGEAQSNEILILSKRLTSRDLSKGQHVCLTWRPNRRCVICHEGDGLFRVVEADNTKLSVGDTFRCHLMIEHEPLFVDNLRHRGAAPVGYVAGRKDGIMFEVLDIKQNDGKLRSLNECQRQA